MFWLLLATGFTGGWTFLFLSRLLYRMMSTPPSAEVLFLPGEDPTERIVHELRSARREVLVQGTTFTSRPIAQALIDTKLRKVNVEVVLDSGEEADPASQLSFLLEQGLAPVIDEEHALLRRAMILIDGRVLVTGTLALAQPPEGNKRPCDAVLVLRGLPDLHAAWRKDFLEHKQHARAPRGVPARPAQLPPGPAPSGAEPEVPPRGKPDKSPVKIGPPPAPEKAA